MAFRGGVPMQTGKRPGGGFDNQFEDLTMNPTPPKRPRTSGTFKAPTQSKTPLKFKFQPLGKNAPLAIHNPIAPKQDLPGSSSRFVSKPVLVSQTAAPPPSKASTQDDPWGDDDDDDEQFLLAGLGNMLSPLDKRKLSPTLVRVVLKVVRIMSRDMSDLLCVRDKEKCFLSSISSLLHATAMADAGSKWEAARGTTRWMAEGLAMEGARRPWVNNSCKWCTGDMVRSMVVVTHSLVTDYTNVEGKFGRQDGWVKETFNGHVNEPVKLRGENDLNGNIKDKVDTMGTTSAISKGEVVKVLKDCVTCLAGMQDKLRVGNDIEESNWVRLLEVTCSVQRRYIWTIDQLHRILDGEPSLVRRINNLTMETKDDDS